MIHVFGTFTNMLIFPYCAAPKFCARHLLSIIYYLCMISNPSSSWLDQDLRFQDRSIERGVTLHVVARGTDYCFL